MLKKTRGSVSIQQPKTVAILQSCWSVQAKNSNLRTYSTSGNSDHTEEYQEVDILL